MARNTNLYSLASVDAYIENCESVIGMDIIEGGLIDTMILYHECGAIEVFEERYLNEWSSAYVRHIYRSGKLPKRFIEALEAQEDIA